MPAVFPCLLTVVENKHTVISAVGLSPLCVSMSIDFSPPSLRDSGNASSLLFPYILHCRGRLLLKRDIVISLWIPLTHYCHTFIFVFTLQVLYGVCCQLEKWYINNINCETLQSNAELVFDWIHWLLICCSWCCLTPTVSAFKSHMLFSEVAALKA